MGKDLNGFELKKGFRQKKDGMYEYRYTDIYGKRVSITDKNYVKLCKKVDIINAKKVLNMEPKKSSITLNKAFDEMMIYNSERLELNTLYNYKYNYDNHVKNTKIGKCKLSDITPLAIQNLLVELSIKNSIPICMVVKSVIKNIYDYAVMSQYVPFNFIPSIQFTKHNEPKKVEALTVREQELFLKFIYETNRSHKDLYVILLNTGLRISEALALTTEDIDFKNRLIKVNKQLLYCKANGIFKETGSKFMFAKPKRNSVREIPMNDKVFDTLQKYINDKRLVSSHPLFESLIFITNRGNPITYSDIRTQLKLMSIKMNELYDCNISLHPHKLRHTFATRCFEAGMNPAIIQKILGHKSLSTTMDLYVTKNVSSLDIDLLNDI